MADGPAGFTRGSTCPALLRIPLCRGRLRVQGSHPLRRAVPGTSPRQPPCNHAVLQPPSGRNRAGLGCSPFARHYWGNHVLFSLPPGTKMFQFPGFASRITRDGSPSDCRVAPFGHPGIKGCLHLPPAFRSLPRPSSPSRAQASAVRPFLLSPPGTLAHPRRMPRQPSMTLSGQDGSVPDLFVSFFPLFQHVNERAGQSVPLWRITDSNR